MICSESEPACAQIYEKRTLCIWAFNMLVAVKLIIQAQGLAKAFAGFSFYSPGNRILQNEMKFNFFNVLH